MADTPGGITIPADITTDELLGLLRNAFNTKIQEAAQQVDPLVSPVGFTKRLKPGQEKDNFVGDSVDDAVFLQIVAEGPDLNQSRKVTTQMNLPLEGSGVSGRTNILGNEEDLRSVYSDAYAADFGHSVSIQMYGIDARELEPAKMAGNAGLARSNKALGVWVGQKKGEYFRQSLVRRVSSNLTDAPLSRPAPLNSNVVVCGLAGSAQAAYSATIATWDQNVRDVLDGVSATDTTFNIPRLIEALPLFEDKYINTVKKDGMNVWLLYVHKDIFNAQSNPDNTKSFASYYQTMAQLGVEDLMKKAFPFGSFMIANKVIVINDPFSPVVGIDADSVNPYYMRQGRVDDRNSVSETKKFYCSLLLGANGTVYHEPEAITYREQTDNHGKFKSIGVTGACGYNNVMFDDDTAGATPLNEGSCLFLSEKSLS